MFMQHVNVYYIYVYIHIRNVKTYTFASHLLIYVHYNGNTIRFQQFNVAMIEDSAQ